MDDQINEGMEKNCLRQLQSEVRFLLNFQIAMAQLLRRRWPQAIDEMAEIASHLAEQARAEGALDDALQFDALINQLDQNFGLPAND